MGKKSVFRLQTQNISGCLSFFSSTKRLLPQTFQDCYHPTTRKAHRCYSRCCPTADSRSGRCLGRLDLLAFGGTASHSNHLWMRHSRPMVTCCHVILVSVDLPLDSLNLKVVGFLFKIYFYNFFTVEGFEKHVTLRGKCKYFMID